MELILVVEGIVFVLFGVLLNRFSQNNTDPLSIVLVVCGLLLVVIGLCYNHIMSKKV